MRESSLKTSALLRLIVIGALAVLLLIPTVFVSLLVSDRQSSRAFAVKEVTDKWGGPQTIVGPILTVPVTRMVKNKEGEVHARTSMVSILPERLALNTTITPEVRNRGIHRVILYSATLNIEADFDSLKRHIESLAKGEVGWSQASVTLGISDLKGIRGIHSMKWNSLSLTPEPRPGSIPTSTPGLAANTALSPDQEQYHFAMSLDVRGSDDFRVVPSARETKVRAEAPWADPSFTGDFLPETRSISSEAFEAEWHVLDFNRSLPQSWVGDQSALLSSSFGVKLFLPVDEYQKTSRALKYAVMFIALTFLAFFVLDVLTHTTFHPVHYSLIGLALVLFYVLLLSVSEYLSFNTSYAIATALTVALISLYSRGISRRTSLALTIAGFLSLLYGFLFVLLQLEDLALLLGSLGLFAIMGIVMYLTRRLDFFALGAPSAQSQVMPPAAEAS